MAEKLVEAARVVFGIPEDAKGPQHLEEWLKKWCVDYKTTVHSRNHTVELLFYKPVTLKWFRNIVQIHARHWKFQREAYCKANLKVMTKEQYLEGGTGPPVTQSTVKLLDTIYNRVVRELGGKAEYERICRLPRAPMQRGEPVEPKRDPSLVGQNYQIPNGVPQTWSEYKRRRLA